MERINSGMRMQRKGREGKMRMGGWSRKENSESRKENREGKRRKHKDD